MIYSLVGLIFFIIVLITNYKLKFLNRSNLIICYVLCLSLLASSVYFGLSSYNENKYVEKNLYLITKYLEDEKFENAKLKIKKINQQDKKSFVQIMAEVIVYNKTDNNVLYSLNMNMAEKYYGNKNEKKELINYIDLNINDDEKLKVICGNLREILNLGKDSEKQLDDYYLIESALMSNENEGIFDSNIIEKIDKYKEDYNDNGYHELMLNYYVSLGDSNSALDECMLILEENDSKENRYTFADIISNMAYNQQNLDIFEDADNNKEIGKLTEELEKLEAKLEEIKSKEQLEINEEKKEKYKKEVENLKDDIDLKSKYVNYLNVYKTLNFISMYDDKDANILKAKLYYAVGEMDKTKEMLINLTKTDTNLFSNKKESSKFAEAYEISENKFNEKIAKEACEDILIPYSSVIFANQQSLLTSDLEKFILNDIKHNNSGLSIVSIDKTEYPKMKIYLDLDKLNEININDGTFIIKDTGHEVEYATEIDKTAGNVVFVVDKSGSMDGQPIMDVKSALSESIESMNDVNISVVEYDDSSNVACELTRNKDVIQNAISKIQTDGGTDIASGIAQGIDVLMDMSGSKTIILMTDGQGSGDIEFEVNRAYDNNIVIHTIGYGDQADGILKDIAENTGGEYLVTNNSSEIIYIYDLIKKYIGNNVIVTYEVKENTEQIDRYIFANLIDGNRTSKKTYMLDNEECVIKEKPVTVESIQQSGFNIEYLEGRSNSSYIYGTNFDKIKEVYMGDMKIDYEIRSNESLIINIPENTTSGIYDFKYVLEGNQEYTIKYAIAVGEWIDQSNLKIGNVEINSDVIILTSDGSYVCTGNNTINSILTTEFNLVVKPENVVINAEDNTIDFGKKGIIMSDGLLYMDPYNYSRYIDDKYENRENIILRDGLYEFDCNEELTKNIVNN